MKVVLIAGFWLNGASWDSTIPVLVANGYDTVALTLPGMDSPEAMRRDIGLRDHVDAVIAEIDRSEGRVVLVGHSAGGAIAHAAADARPERVARVIYVDSIPLGAQRCVNAELPVVDGEIPLPDWSVFDPEDLVDLTDDLRESMRARAVPVPARVASDLQELHDPRRYDVATTIITCEFSGAQLREWIDEGHDWMAELGAMRDVTYVELATGHWPQFTKPAELADALVAALRAD